MRTPCVAALLITVGISTTGQTTTSINQITYTPQPGTSIVGVLNDSAPNFGTGSVKASASAEIKLSASTLFPRTVKLREIRSISYWTKKKEPHWSLNSPQDWTLSIEITPDETSPLKVSACINPLAESVNEWNIWDTDPDESQVPPLSGFGVLWFLSDNPSGCIEGVDWATFVANPERGEKEVLSFSFITDGWTENFDAQLDGFQVELADVSATVNFEAVPVPTTKAACKGDGWKKVSRNDGSKFKNQGDCVQYVLTGK
jgi:hypothetical protein